MTRRYRCFYRLLITHRNVHHTWNSCPFKVRGWLLRSISTHDLFRRSMSKLDRRWSIKQSLCFKLLILLDLLLSCLSNCCSSIEKAFWIQFKSWIVICLIIAIWPLIFLQWNRMRQIWVVIEHYLPIVTYSYIVLLAWLWCICLLDYIEVSFIWHWLFIRTILQV